MNWKTTCKKAISFLNKATVLGFYIDEIETLDGKYMYLVNKNEESILYIPSDVTHTELKVYMTITGNLKVIGGENVISYKELFNKVRLKTLDLRDMVTDKCEDMRLMFSSSYIDKIIFGENWNTSKVKTMKHMFSHLNMNLFDLTSSVLELDLNNWDMSNVDDVSAMFYASDFKKLEINKWNLKPGVYSVEILDHIKIDTLDLSGLNLRKMKLCNDVTELRLDSTKFTRIKNIIIDKDDYVDEIVNRYIKYLKSKAEITIIGDEL